MKNRIKFLFIMLFISRAFTVGEAGAVFLLINPGSPAAGAGEAQVAKADDAYASYYNPAGLGFLRGKEVVLQHVNWLPNLADDIFYEFLGYRHFVEGLGTFGGHLIYLNLGEQIEMDAQGNEQGKFSSYMMAFNVSYGTQISQKKSVGMNFKVFHQKLADQPVEGETGDPFSTDFAFDIGYLQKFGKNSQHRFGFSIQNIGPPIDFIDSGQADPAPTNMKLGLYTELFDDGTNKINLLFDANKLLVAAYPAMDWDGNGLINGSKEEAHSDPWYKGVFTGWLDDWYYGGDYDLCKSDCQGFREDLDLELTYGKVSDKRIGGYYELVTDYIDNDGLYPILSDLNQGIGDFSEYWINGGLYNHDGSLFAQDEFMSSLDWIIENYNHIDLDGNVIEKIDAGILHVPNYNGFCEQQYSNSGGYVYGQSLSTGSLESGVSSAVEWHKYSMCYDEEGDSYYESINIGDFNNPEWMLIENENYSTLTYIDLPYDGLGKEFDVFDPACNYDGNFICDEQTESNGILQEDVETPTNGEAHFDVMIEGQGEYNFKDSEYGKYNAYGDFEKGSGKERKFKDELEEMIYNFGMEWEYTENFVMRLGFIYDQEGQIKSPTFGAGINFDQYGFDFGYTAGDKGHPRENTMFFSLSLGL